MITNDQATTVVERVQAAMPRLLLSATSVDMEVREEADDAVTNLIAHVSYLENSLSREREAREAMYESMSAECARYAENIERLEDALAKALGEA